MRDAVNIRIEELILHILDPQGQGLVLSNIPVPLSANEALVDYFSTHIQGSLKDPVSSRRVFATSTPSSLPGSAATCCAARRPCWMARASLAQDLYALLERDQRITPGDLAVCFYKADNYPYTRFLAIMKIDPSQIFNHVIRQDKRGNTYVSFESNAQAFTGERLQKCAFIQPLEPRHPEFDMLLLDRQRRLDEAASRAGAIAQFFSESFLDAQEVLDSRKFTDMVYRGMLTAENKVRSRLTEEEGEQLEERIHQAVTSRRLNLDNWLESLPLADELKQEIDQSVSARLPVREFPIDRGLSQQLMSKVKFRGDHNLRLEVPAENYFTLVASEEYVTDDPNRKPFYRIVIETEQWKRMA